MRKEVVIIQRIFPNYRKEVFDHLRRHIDFQLLHSSCKNEIPKADSKYAYPISCFQYGKKESHLFLNVFPHILKYRPKIIIHEFSIGIISLLPTFLFAKFLGCKWILWGHGYDHSKGFDPKNSLADRFRLILVRKSDAVIFYAPEAKAQYAPFVKSTKLFVANNCLNTEKLSTIRDRLDREGKLKVKERIGFAHRYNLIYVGRILKNKMPQYLIEAAAIIHQKLENDLAIHFVGDGPYLQNLQQLAATHHLINIYFHGQIQDDEKTGEMLFASDLLVMPGYVGLSVNHALNFDCPVVTYQQKKEGPFHSPEITYIIEAKTGYIVEDHTASALAQTIQRHLLDPESKESLKYHIRDTVSHQCSIHQFTTGFRDALAFALKTNENTHEPAGSF